MEKFEYNITKHPSEGLNQLVFACTTAGDCQEDHVPQEQTKFLADLLNKRGDLGWELVQVNFGKNGLMAFWKRKIVERQ